eukprot:543203_1
MQFNQNYPSWIPPIQQNQNANDAMSISYNLGRKQERSLLLNLPQLKEAIRLYENRNNTFGINNNLLNLPQQTTNNTQPPNTTQPPNYSSSIIPPFNLQIPPNIGLPPEIKQPCIWVLCKISRDEFKRVIEVININKMANRSELAAFFVQKVQDQILAIWTNLGNVQILLKSKGEKNYWNVNKMLWRNFHGGNGLLHCSKYINDALGYKWGEDLCKVWDEVVSDVNGHIKQQLKNKKKKKTNSNNKNGWKNTAHIDPVTFDCEDMGDDESDDSDDDIVTVKKKKVIKPKKILKKKTVKKKNKKNNKYLFDYTYRDEDSDVPIKIAKKKKKKPQLLTESESDTDSDTVSMKKKKVIKKKKKKKKVLSESDSDSDSDSEYEMKKK